MRTWIDEFGRTALRMEPSRRSLVARDELAHSSLHQGFPDDPVLLVVRYSKNGRPRRILFVAATSGGGLLTERRTAAQPWRRELVFMPPHLPFAIPAGIGTEGWSRSFPNYPACASQASKAVIHRLKPRQRAYSGGVAGR